MLELQHAVGRSDVVGAVLPDLGGFHPPALLEIGDSVVAMEGNIPEIVDPESGVELFAADLVEIDSPVGNGVQAVSEGLVGLIRLRLYAVCPLEYVLIGIV